MPGGRLIRAFAVYTGLRLLLLAVAYGLALAVGGRGPLALVAALLASSLASLFVLRRQRDRFAEALAAGRAARVDRRRELRKLLDE